MSSQLEDPSEAVPASVAAAMAEGLSHPELAAAFAALSTSSRAALATADELRTARRLDQVEVQHLLLGLWAKTGGEARTAFDRAGWPIERIVSFLADSGLDAPAADEIRAAYTRGARNVRAGFAMPPLAPAVQQALLAAYGIAELGFTVTGPVRQVQLRHLFVGAMSVLSGPLRPMFAAVGPVAADVLRTAATMTSAGTIPTEAIEREQQAIAQLWAAATPAVEAHDAEPAGAPTADAAPASGPRTGTGGGAANDQAEGDDRLNFSHYVQAFANLIDSPDTKPPLTIGIFGAWGSGKSFLLRHLTDEINRRGAKLRPPLALAFGAWLRRRVRGEHLPAGRAFVHCVAFNAWEYNATEHIWPRLVRRVLDSVTRDARWHRRPLRWAEALGRKLQRNFARKLRADWKSLVAWLAVGAGVWWGFAHFRPADAATFATRVFGVETATDKFSVPAIVGALTAAVKLLVDTLLAPLGGWVTALLDDGPGYGGETDFVRAVRADLDLVDRLLVAEKSRVLIMIDDLDRCEPDKAVEVLQAINQLLDRRSFVVCLGIDARVITAAVEKHYEELLGPAGVTGYEYLDKIIQIPFRIPDPTPDELSLFVSKQLGDPTPEHAGHASLGTATSTMELPARGAQAPTPHAASEPIDAERLVRAAADSVLDGPLGIIAGAASPGVTVAMRQGANVAVGFVAEPAPPPESLSFTHHELVAFQAVAPFLRPNPRHVKRLVNVYALVRSLAALGRNTSILDDPAATVRWLTLCAQWPYAVRAMLLHLDAHGPPAADGDEADTPPLRYLHDAVRTSLDSTKQARFDHDTLVLERLVASSEGLSWDELRVLRAYTVNFNPALDAELRAELTERPPHRLRPATTGQPYDRRTKPTPMS